MSKQPQRGYAPVNGLEMYYEIHGKGKPLLLLHGGMTSIDGTFPVMLPTFAKNRQVIAVEQQGHGHTADIDRPLSFGQMTDDTAVLLKYLKIEQADVFGYSSGGAVALGLAIRYPEMVDKLVVASTAYDEKGYYPEIFEGLKHAKAEYMPEQMQQAYASVAPRPEDWSKLVEKASRQANEDKGWTQAELKAIQSPTLAIAADGDIVRPEYTVEMFRLFPKGKLAILPDSDHMTIMFQRAEWMLSMITGFLDG